MNDFDLGDLRRVLAECQEYEAGHHLGRPFMSAYQIAIRFADAHPQHPLVKKLHVGGKGTGPDPSLANCIARFLSAAVKDGKAGDIEGGFISHAHIGDLWFDCHGQKIGVSGLTSKAGHSIFRLVQSPTAD